MLSKGNLKRLGAVVLVAALIIGYACTPMLGEQLNSTTTAYAMTQNQITASSTGDESGIIDGSANVSILIENGRNQPATLSNIKLSIAGGGVTVDQNNSTFSVAANGTQTLYFPVQISNQASAGEYSCSFSATVSGLTNVSSVEERFTFEVFDNLASQKSDNNAVAAVNISNAISPAEGFSEGDNNTLTLTLFNNGNTTIKNATAQLSLPDGLSVYNGSNSANLGYITVGEKKKATFMITVDKNITSKNYAIGVRLEGVDGKNNAVDINKTFYVPVSGSGAFDTNNISITNVSIPDQVSAGTPFDLNFTVQNSGSSDIKNVKVNVEPAEGIINKSRNIFIDNIPKGGSKQYTVRLYSFDGADEKSYPIKITAAPTDSTEKEATGVIQYATVTLLSDGSTAKKPQLMVDSYTYGGSTVQAGTTFSLNLDIFNTSGKTLSNVKVSLSNADGVFVPVGGSNSFFIDSIKAKSHYTTNVMLTTKPQAEEKNTPITVTMSYEAGSGDPLESTDTISIPITQKSRLVVDDIVPPTEVYVGQPGTCEVQFYNMGKTPLNNLRVNCKGNFDVAESNSYYVGNMESGKSDSYRFNFIPKGEGAMEGIITFTFEDGNGDAQFLEVPFNFEVMEAPVFEEDPSLAEDAQKHVPWALIIAGAVAVVVIIGVLLFKRHRKKKLNKALEIDDDFDVDRVVDETPTADNK